MSRVFFSAPCATGKTRFKDELAEHFGCTMIIDDWSHSGAISVKSLHRLDGVLILSNEAPPEQLPSNTRVVQGEEALQILRKMGGEA